LGLCTQRTDYRRNSDHYRTANSQFFDNVCRAARLGRRSPQPGRCSKCLRTHAMSERERFDFAFDSRFLPFLFGVGVTPGTAFVVLTAHDRLLARFGPWRVLTPLENVSDVCVMRPYSWFNSIGARMSFACRGVMFSTWT